MARTDVSEMAFNKVFSCLVAKVERKGRTRKEVLEVTSWLTGYSADDLAKMEQDGTTYGSFINNAPHWNEKANEVKGTICGVKVEEIEDVFTWKYRCLDKLVDELAKGKPLEKILR